MLFESIKSILDTLMTTSLLFGGIFLTILLKFPQFRYGKRFLSILSSKQASTSHAHTVTPLQALFTAMSTSLGMGSMVTPPLMIAIGGPGALFWFVIYAFFGSVTKFAEVALAVKFKKKSPEGVIIGGPVAYLWEIHHVWGYWYGALSLILFAAWTGAQAKTFADVYTFYNIPEYVSGAVLAIFIFYMLIGGAKRIGEFSSKLVPIMCSIYLVASAIILFHDIPLLSSMIQLVFADAFTPSAAMGGFIGATMFQGIREGIFKGVFTTEAGVGTAAIPHAMTDAKQPSIQGTLAMYSVAVDTFFCLISGFVCLVTGVWTSGKISNALIFKAFELGFPTAGPYVLTFSISLFILGTALGNSFNGSKNFAFFTNNKYINYYFAFIALFIMIGSVMYTQTLWNAIELFLPLIVMPNIIGVIYLTWKHKKELTA